MKTHKLLNLPYTAKALQAVIDCSEHRFCTATKPNRKWRKWGYPFNPLKKGKIMRKRDTPITIRVTSEEKKMLERKAKKCGQSLSAYLRTVGLDKNISVAPPPELKTLYKQATNFGNSRFANLALKALQRYGGDDVGNDKDMDN